MWPINHKPGAPEGDGRGGDEGAGPHADEAQLRSIEKVLRQFLARYHAEGRGGLARLRANHNLWRAVSSLTLLELVAFVEERFAITVRPIDFAPQNFSSLSTIARFVAARRAGVAER